MEKEITQEPLNQSKKKHLTKLLGANNMITSSIITVLSAQSLTADFNSPAINVSQYSGYAISNVYTIGGGTSAGNMKLQVSDDGTNFIDYPSSTKAVDI